MCPPGVLTPIEVVGMERFEFQPDGQTRYQEHYRCMDGHEWYKIIVVGT